MIMLVAAGKMEDIFGTGLDVHKAFEAHRAPGKVTARLYGGPLHGETFETPPAPMVCVSGGPFNCETFDVYTYELALSGGDLEKWVAAHGHWPYQI